MKTQKYTHLIVFVVAVIGVTYAALYFSKAEAVYSRTVGTISVLNFVPNAGAGTEYVELAFSGILGKDSIANLDGWTLENEGTFTYDLSDVVLTSNDSIKICESAATDPSCDYHWQGNDVFADAAGELYINNREGVTTVHITYSEPAAGQTLSGSGDYTDDVYTASDKLMVCEAQNKGTVRERNMSVQHLIANEERDKTAGTDTIPAFVYERKKSLGYHPGVNWPEGKAFLEGGCVQ